MKASPKAILIGSVVIGILIFIAAWHFIYSEDVKKAENIANNNKTIQARVDELNIKLANRPIYQEGIENAQKIIDAVFAKYGPGNTVEKSIMFVIEMSRVTGCAIASITFQDDQPIYTSSELDENGVPKEILYKGGISFSISAGYTGFKKYVDFINSYKERMNLNQITLAYNAETGMLTSGISLNMYAVKDANHTYVAPVIEDIPIGVENIFKTIEVLQVDENGNPINPEDVEQTANTGDAVNNDNTTEE